MTWEIDEPPPTPEEIAEARALAESLEGGRRDTLGAAGAVALLRDEAKDELARLRLRRALVADASPWRRRTRHALALAASLLLAAGLGALLLHRPAPSEEALASRERDARQALATLLASRATSTSDGVSRVATALVAARQESLLSSLTRERNAALLGSARTAPSASPTPGGRS